MMKYNLWFIMQCLIRSMLKYKIKCIVKCKMKYVMIYEIIYEWNEMEWYINGLKWNEIMYRWCMNDMWMIYEWCINERKWQ